MTDHDIALVGCSAVAQGPPNVPSTMTVCAKCGAEVWFSDVLMESLVDRGYMAATIQPLCFYTCLVVQEGATFDITDEQRSALRARGLTDTMIRRTMEMAAEMVQKEDDHAGLRDQP